MAHAKCHRVTRESGVLFYYFYLFIYFLFDLVLLEDEQKIGLGVFDWMNYIPI